MIFDNIPSTDSFYESPKKGKSDPVIVLGPIVGTAEANTIIAFIAGRLYLYDKVQDVMLDLTPVRASIGAFVSTISYLTQAKAKDAVNTAIKDSVGVDLAGYLDEYVTDGYSVDMKRLIRDIDKKSAEAKVRDDSFVRCMTDVKNFAVGTKPLSLINGTGIIIGDAGAGKSVIARNGGFVTRVIGEPDPNSEVYSRKHFLRVIAQCLSNPVSMIDSLRLVILDGKEAIAAGGVSLEMAFNLDALTAFCIEHNKLIIFSVNPSTERGFSSIVSSFAGSCSNAIVLNQYKEQLNPADYIKGVSGLVSVRYKNLRPFRSFTGV